MKLPANWLNPKEYADPNEHLLAEVSKSLSNHPQPPEARLLINFSADGESKFLKLGTLQCTLTIPANPDDKKAQLRKGRAKLNQTAQALGKDGISNEALTDVFSRHERGELTTGQAQG